MVNPNEIIAEKVRIKWNVFQDFSNVTRMADISPEVACKRSKPANWLFNGTFPITVTPKTPVK